MYKLTPIPSRQGAVFRRVPPIRLPLFDCLPTPSIVRIDTTVHDTSSIWHDAGKLSTTACAILSIIRSWFVSVESIFINLDFSKLLVENKGLYWFLNFVLIDLSSFQRYLIY